MARAMTLIPLLQITADPRIRDTPLMKIVVGPDIRLYRQSYYPLQSFFFPSVFTLLLSRHWIIISLLFIASNTLDTSSSIRHPHINQTLSEVGPFTKIACYASTLPKLDDLSGAQQEEECLRQPTNEFVFLPIR